MAIDIRDIVAPPSVGALAYQADALIRELDNITKEEYPTEAVIIKYVLLAIADYLRDKLCALHQKPNPDELNYKQARALGGVVHSTYSFISHLKESSPLQSPPAIQGTLSRLTKLYFPDARNVNPICLIQPQWEYNLEYIPLRWKLIENVEPSELDPDFSLGATEPEEFLSALWQRYWDNRNDHGPSISEYEKKNINQDLIPIQVAVLSFARLDTNDTLLFPLLAHELGHFIDYSESTPRHVKEIISGRLKLVRKEDVESVLKQETGTDPAPETVYRHLNRLNGLVEICLRELLADQLAIRMLGFSFFVALAEFLKTIASWGEATLLNRGYPGIGFRLRAAFDEMIDPQSSSCVRPFLDKYTKDYNNEATGLLAYLNEWDNRLPSIPRSSQPNAADVNNRKTLDRILHELAEQAVVDGLGDLRRVACELMPNCTKLSPHFFRRIDMLRNDLPPFCQGDSGEAFAEILAAGWAYQCVYGEKKEKNPDTTFRNQLDEYQKTCRLILKAVELLSSESTAFDLGSTDKELKTRVGVLSQNAIKRRIVQLHPGDDGYLGIIPYVGRALQGASLEVHLGNRFTIARRTRMHSVDIEDKEQQELLKIIGREKVFVLAGDKFLVHPGDFILGATLEFVSLPRDLMAFVEGKSSIGRTGLLIATATQIAPGFHGVIVLELANTGTVPLEIKPGMAIAQLVFQTMSESLPDDCMYRGKHYCQIEP